MAHSREGHIDAVQRALICFLALCCLAAAGRAQDSTLIAFALKDQFKRSYTEKTWAGEILVVLGSDKDGSAYNAPWGRALKDSLAVRPQRTAIRLVGLSDLRSVPFFLKGFVRGKFPQDRAQWVLMDWRGVFPKAYHFVEKHCNILVFDTRGHLVAQVAVQEVEKKALQRLLKALDALLAE